MAPKLFFCNYLIQYQYENEFHPNQLRQLPSAAYKVVMEILVGYIDIYKLLLQMINRFK